MIAGASRRSGRSRAVQEQRFELIETLERSRIEVDAAAGFEAP